MNAKKKIRSVCRKKKVDFNNVWDFYGTLTKDEKICFLMKYEIIK